MALSLLRRMFGVRASGAKTASKPAPRKSGFRPQVDGLEQRLVPTWSFKDLSVTSPAALLQNLTNGKETIANLQYKGDNAAAALFTDTGNTLGFTSGVILSSGKASNAAGPNSSSSITGSFNTASDPDLDALISPISGHDASVLTFDYIPKGSFVYFTYVFGSDEYPEFAPPNGGINDVFAFFVNNINVSTIPGTNLAVSINNVNPITNTKYYVDNNTAKTHDTQMDGYTTVLTVTLPVVPGKLNKVKLAIEDASDSILDSWVMIKTGSLQSFVVAPRGPVRYTYASGLYTGMFQITNNNPFAYTGTAYLVFDSLPPGVSVVNKTGLTPSGKPYIAITSGFKANGSASINVIFSNPLKANLATFFQSHATSMYVTTQLI